MGTNSKMAKMMCGEEETELRLGLPGGGGSGSGDGKVAAAAAVAAPARKRRFPHEKEEENIVGLKLNLLVQDQVDAINPSSSSSSTSPSCMDLKNKNNDHNKVVAMAAGTVNNKTVLSEDNMNHHDAAVKPPAKAQVVGWPPVRSFRKNVLAVKNSNLTTKESTDQKMKNTGTRGAGLIKVSIDGAPYLRKVDLKMYKSYQDLSDALGKMFGSFTIGTHGMIDFMNESKLMDLLNGSDYVPTYEDKDGDWMLVGDVPWEMFVDSCKRLRIMKAKEAVGLAPRAMEKCKSRS